MAKKESLSFEYKLVVAVRADLGISSGKMAAQVGHAAVMAALDAKANSARWFSMWIREGQKKVVVRVMSLDELRELEARARRLKLVTAMVEDAGMTELPPGTVTCLGIGPGPNSVVDQVTGHLPLW